MKLGQVFHHTADRLQGSIVAATQIGVCLHVAAGRVEVTSKNDVALFISSGFEPAATTKAQPQGLSQNIRSIDHGANSEQIVLRLKAVPQAASYELRYAAAVILRDDSGPTLFSNAIYVAQQ
jgi:hypothetical protein